MTFVTEKVTSQDIEKYGLPALNEIYRRSSNYEWTIDRDRDIYLRRMGQSWQEPEFKIFSFYWKGHELEIGLRSVSYERTASGALHQTWAISPLPGSTKFWLPPELELQRPQITSDLKEALVAFGTAGIANAYTAYVATFQF